MRVGACMLVIALAGWVAGATPARADDAPAPPAPGPEAPAPAPDAAIGAPPSEAPTPLPPSPAPTSFPPVGLTDVVVPCGPPPCCVPCRPRFEVVVEGTWSFLEGPEGEVGEPVPAAVPALRWDENDYDGELGVRATVRRHCGACDTFEVRGIWYGGFDAESTQFGSVGFSPPPGGFFPPANAVLTSEADVYGLEATWWRSARCGCATWSTGLGARVLRFDETARVFVPGVIGGGANASVDSEADNWFFGAQVGGRVDWCATRRLELGLTAKGLIGGVYGNLDVSDENVFAGGVHSASDEVFHFGWGVELEAAVRLHLTRRVALTAGYVGLFLDGIVRADDAMDFSQATTGAVQVRDVTDGILLHTFFAGVQISF